MTFDEYLGGAVLQPLEMSRSELVGSPAHGLRSTAADIGRFLAELQRPTLLDDATAADAVRPQFPALAGIVPGVGRFDPCPWGLGFEIRGQQVATLDRPHQLAGDVRTLRRRRNDGVGRSRTLAGRWWR